MLDLQQRGHDHVPSGQASSSAEFELSVNADLEKVASPDFMQWLLR